MAAGLTPFQLNYSEAEQFRQIVRQHGAELRVSIPAFLAEDLAADQTVTVQIAIQERVRTPAGAQWWDLPPIQKVPIVIPRGGGFSVTLPLKKGDEGLLVFCDACFDFWWLNGKNDAPRAQNLDPGQSLPSGSQIQCGVVRHDFWDCGFIPGMFSQPNKLSNYSTTSLQIRSDDGNTIIDVAETAVTVTAAHVNVESSGGTPLALMNDTFYQWYVANIQPFLVSKGYAGPGIPTGSETSVLKGQ